MKKFTEEFTIEELLVLIQMVTQVAVPQTVDGKGDKDLALLRSIKDKVRQRIEALKNQDRPPIPLAPVVPAPVKLLSKRKRRGK